MEMYPQKKSKAKQNHLTKLRMILFNVIILMGKISCFSNITAYIPIVEQDVWCPHLVCSEAKVFDTWVLRLVPLQIMIIPVLRNI